MANNTDLNSEENTYHVNNLYNEQELKKVTQDFICEYIRYKGKYEENVKYSNIRVALSLVLIFIGLYCCVFLSYKKNPNLMIQLLVAFFISSLILFIFEYFCFGNSFIIVKSNNTEKSVGVKFSLYLDKNNNVITVVAKMDELELSVSFELKKLYNAEGYLVIKYAERILQEFLHNLERKFRLKKSTKKN